MKRRCLIAVVPFLGICMCTSAPKLATVPHVEIERFMGPWYVIANIPTFLEKGAHNAIESYKLDPNGSIATTFTFHADGFDGPLKTYKPRGFTRDKKSNAVWDMQFLWPFRSEYLIIYLDSNYTLTVIGRSKLDYVWIMARTPEIPDADYQAILKKLSGIGYDTTRIRKVPQRWDKNKRQQ
jgi:apolipoprotein D and lipocalin family protein